MEEVDVAQIRVLPYVGAERFAEFVFNKLNEFIQAETEGRVSVVKVEFKEHDRNSAIYEG
jgi:hypothetical protein